MKKLLTLLLSLAKLLTLTPGAAWAEEVSKGAENAYFSVKIGETITYYSTAG